MGSMHWTEDEAKYLKAIFSWQARADDDAASRTSRNRLDLLQDVVDSKKNPPAGEFRVLVVGAKSCGKTSILTRFCANTFRGETEPADPFFERGCRHQMDLAGEGDGGQQEAKPGSSTCSYVVDALEMPSKHLSSNLMLEQALNITEGAVLIYDITNAASLRLAVRVHDFIRDSLLAGAGQAPREYALLLVGNKSDVDDDDRAVSWAEASRTAASFKVRASFMEVSAKTGDNVAAIFPTLGREILRLKKLSRQRREEADRAALLKLKTQSGGSSLAGRSSRRGGIWRAIANSFTRRRNGSRVQTI